MHKQADQVVQILKSKGLRVTPQRFAVYANLLDRADHPTAEQILSDLNQNAPTSSQATVYLSLQTLRDSGLVREVLLEQGVCRYDGISFTNNVFGEEINKGPNNIVEDNDGKLWFGTEKGLGFYNG